MQKIYTKTGDKGTTSLFDGTRVAKNNIRVETYGAIDELNSVLGVAVSLLKKHTALQEILLVLQKDLLDIGSVLANPGEELSESFAVYLENRILFFETTMDKQTEAMPKLTNFILPGGATCAAMLQVARTLTRKAERKLVGLSKTEHVDEVVIKYFNRLSDLLFTMARFINFEEKQEEIVWTKYVG